MRLLVRADANEDIGFGHLIRSMALAEITADKFEEVVIVTQSPVQSAKVRIKELGFDLLELRLNSDYDEEAQFLVNNVVEPSDRIILDGYCFDTVYQAHLVRTGMKVITIDDKLAFPFVSDAIINPAVVANPEKYIKLNSTSLYYGLDYTLLRRQFLQGKNRVQDSRTNEIFICFGGSDSENFTELAILAASGVAEVTKINVVLGPFYKKSKRWKSLIDPIQDKIKIYQDLEVDEMVEVMKECDLAIVPASSISLESMAMHIPLILGLTSDNQECIYDTLVMYPMVCGVGYFQNIDHTLLASQVTNNLNKFYEPDGWPNFSTKHLKEVFENL